MDETPESIVPSNAPTKDRAWTRIQWRLRCLHVETSMGPSLVVVSGVGPEDPLEVTPPKHDHPVHTLGPRRAASRPVPRSPGRKWPRSDPLRPRPGEAASAPLVPRWHDAGVRTSDVPGLRPPGLRSGLRRQSIRRGRRAAAGPRRGHSVMFLVVSMRMDVRGIHPPPRISIPCRIPRTRRPSWPAAPTA